MSKNLTLLRERVQALMPDLKIEQLEVNQEGLVNDVVIVNQNLVFRFAKGIESAKVLENELKILDLIRPNLELEVPTPIISSNDCMVYPYLRGKPLYRETLSGFSEEIQTQLAQQLGSFLYALHTTQFSELEWEIPSTLAPVTREAWLDIRKRVDQKIYPLLMKNQIRWAENLFDNVLEHPNGFEYDPALIHGDLAAYHILYNPQKIRMSGVLDFGVAGIGDPALDIGNLMTSYGERFVTKMEVTYLGLDAYLPRARFYAQSIELQWVLSGLETGENFWFTAHLGGARDIQVSGRSKS